MQKDIISKTIIKKLITDLARYVLNLELDNVEVLETQHQRVEERRADIVVRVSETGSGRSYILHIEIQNNNNAIISARMLRYLSDIKLQWPDEEVIQFLIYTGNLSNCTVVIFILWLNHIVLLCSIALK